MRKTTFAIGEYYHIYNRGTDKREIFLEKYDLGRFMQSLVDFNTVNPIGSIYENRFKSKLGSLAPKLVNIVAYCLNPNHFHLILEQLTDRGIEKFMHRLGGGYTNFFNEKYKRSGSLFQGTYKAIHIDSNKYLLHLSAYVNLNYRVHRYAETDFYKSSLDEYLGRAKNLICKTDVVMDQFKSSAKYLDFALSSVESTLELREFEFEDVNLGA